MMNKKVLKALAGMLSAVITVSVPVSVFAAQKAVLIDACVGSNILSSENEFAENAGSWAAENSIIDVRDGAAVITPQSGGNYGMSTSIGADIYRNASSVEGLYWDFESSSDITENISLESGGDLGKWTTARKTNTFGIESATEVELYNKGYYDALTEAGEDLKDEADPSKANDKANSADGSESCLMVFNPPEVQWKAMMGARVKLSRDMVKPGEEYTLTYYFTHNTKPRPMYAGFAPYSEDELDNINDGDAGSFPIIEKNSDGTFNEDTNNVPIGGVKGGNAARQWTEYSVKIVPREEDFNSDGYTTLWLLSAGSQGLNKTKWDIYPYEKFYLDNISLTRNTGKAEINEYTFVMKVRGEAGTKVSASAEIDGDYEIFSGSKIIERSDTWETMLITFRISSDMFFLEGSKVGSPFASDNNRAVLDINISGRAGIEADSIYILKNMDRNALNENKGKQVYFIIDVLAFDKISSVNLKCKAGTNSFFSKSVPIEKGKQTIIVKSAVPTRVDSGYINLSMVYAWSQEMFDKEYLLFPNFTDGYNIYPSTEALKIYGEGIYLVEFSVEGGTENDTATVRIGAVEIQADISAEGKAVAEVTLKENDIKSVTDDPLLSVECSKEIGDITVRRIADIQK